MEELRIEENNIIEVEEQNEEMPVENENGGSIVGKLVVGGLLAFAGVCAGRYVKKNKDHWKAKKTEKQIAKLEKQGYFVCKESDMANVDNPCDVEPDIEE